MDERVVKHLDDLVAAIRSGTDWATTQGGLLAQEIIAYNQTVAIMWIFVAVFVIAVCVWGVVKLRKMADDSPRFMFPLVFFILAIVVLFCSIGTVIKCETAPRLVVLESVGKIIKK